VAGKVLQDVCEQNRNRGAGRVTICRRDRIENVRDRKEIERADGKFPPEAIVDIEAEQLQLTAHTPPTSRGAEEGIDCPTETHLKRTGRLVLVMAKCSFYSD